MLNFYFLKMHILYAHKIYAKIRSLVIRLKPKIFNFHKISNYIKKCE